MPTAQPKMAPLSTTALTALALVLGWAGVAKLRSGGASSLGGRALGGGELLLAVGALVGPARITAPILAVAFAGFCAAHARAWRAGAADCGCFGEGAARPASPRVATVVTAATALVAAAIALADPPSIAALVARDVAAAALATAGGVAGALAWRRLFAARAPALHWIGSSASARRRSPPPIEPVPGARASERLLAASSLLLERRFSRRTALERIALGGSALAVAPLRYLLYPVSAMAAIAPGHCGSGLCTDGYTEFCCQINDGANTCPEGTFAGGWWMCTDYPGRRLCAEQGVRYYIDCNALPHRPFPGGCRCGRDRCDHRRVACNVFRYGQCNTHVRGVTAVVCRMVVCEHPARVPALNCSSSLAVDDAVCHQDAPCLEPNAVELAGAGGV